MSIKRLQIPVYWISRLILFAWVAAISFGSAISASEISRTTGLIEEPIFTVQAGTVGLVKPGAMIEVEISVAWQGSVCPASMSGFNLVVAYDTTAVFPWDVIADSLPDGCSYRSLRFALDFPVCEHCPAAVLRITGDVEPGDGHSGDACLWPDGRLLRLQFQTFDDADLYGADGKFDFFWRDCGDNILWTTGGDTTFLADNVFDSEGNNIADENCPLPSYLGPHIDCVDLLEIGSTLAIKNAVFGAARVDFLPEDSIGVRGDVNLDGLSFEVDDFDIFRDFFLYGDSIFSLGKRKQVRACDIDFDGIDTTLADLVTMRFAIHNETSFRYDDDTPVAQFIYEAVPGILMVGIDADYSVGAYNLWFETGNTIVDSVVFYDYGHLGEHGGSFSRVLSDSLRLLFIEGTQMMPLIDGEDSQLLTIFYQGNEPVPVIERAVSGVGTNFEIRVPTGIDESTQQDGLLPNNPSLYQNYPNPFNLSTCIEFELPQRSPWRLEIRNVIGQLVDEFSGVSGPGTFRIQWDACDRHKIHELGSGIYFYRLLTPSFVNSRKMILLK